MKSALAALLLSAATAMAHPGVGIVVDSRGNLFYTDLHQVWVIAPDGSRRIAVPNVHTHELCTDTKDFLYGEHLWYKNEAWGSRVWRRSPDGQVVDIVPAHAGFNDNFCHPRVRIPRERFRDVRWMTVAPDGTVYLIDTVDLMRVSPEGKVTTVARGLSDAGVMRFWAGTRHRLMGLWLDRAGNVYVADYAGGNVKRVDGNGRVTVVARSTYPWAPTGGTFDRNGSLWLLEYAINDVRVRKVRLR